MVRSSDLLFSSVFQGLLICLGEHMMMATLILIWVHLHIEAPNKFGGFQIQVSWYQFGYKWCEGDFETTHIIEKKSGSN